MKKIRVNRLTMIIGTAIFLTVSFMIVRYMINGNDPELITCTRENKVSDFTISDDITVYLAEEKISRIDYEKSILVGDTFTSFSQYDATVLSQFENAYKYLDKDQYKIKQKNHKTTATLSIKESGVILNNINITAKDPDNKLYVEFNVVNNLESASSVIKINDNYTKKELKKELESFDFKCE